MTDFVPDERKKNTNSHSTSLRVFPSTTRTINTEGGIWHPHFCAAEVYIYMNRENHDQDNVDYKHTITALQVTMY